MYDWSKHPRFLVYALTDPRTGAIRYIGRSSTGPARPVEHATRIAREKTHKAAWVRSLLREGAMYGVLTLEICKDKASTVEAEIRWIAHGRAAGWDLTNHTDGGEGSSVKKLNLPDDKIVARYEAGESELAIARAYGVQRWTIRRRLIEGGATIRSRSVAMSVRMGRMTYEQRKANVTPAHRARRREDAPQDDA